MSESKTVAIASQPVSGKQMVAQSQSGSPTFDQMRVMAASMAKSGLFGIKDPDQALSLMMIAVAEGKHPALVARDYNIIQGRAAKNAEAMLRDFQGAGGRVDWHELTDKSVSATFSHPQGGSVKISWDMERAAQAGLNGKDNWKKFPRQMLRSRVVSEGVRTVWPSATSGLYAPEEMQDIVSDTVPEPVSVEAAVEAATSPNKVSPDELDAMIASMDVTTIKELRAAFQAAWKRCKEAGDQPAQEKVKAVYDTMRADIESGAIS